LRRAHCRRTRPTPPEAWRSAYAPHPYLESIDDERASRAILEIDAIGVCPREELFEHRDLLKGSAISGAVAKIRGLVM